MFINSVAVLFATVPVTFVTVLVVELKLAVAVSLVVGPLTLIAGSRRIVENAFAVFHALFPVPYVFVTQMIIISAAPVLLAHVKLAFVSLVALFVVVHSVPMFFVGMPISLVASPIRVGIVAFPLFFSQMETAFVVLSVLKHVHTFAVELVLFPATEVNLAGAVKVDSFSVPDLTAKFANVIAPVFKLLLAVLSPQAASFVFE